MYTLTTQAAEGLTVLDVAPSRDEIEQWIAELARRVACAVRAGARD